MFSALAIFPRAGQAANNDQFVALQALNHSLMAVEMVLRQPDRATVDAQRFAIVEQLELPASVLKVSGKNKENSLQTLLGDLTRLFRESGNDPAGLARAREAEEAVVMAALARVPEKTALVAGSAREKFTPLARGVMNNGPLGSLLALAENPADNARPLSTLNEGSGEKLDQAVIERFASLRKQLLAVREDFVNKSRLPAREVMTDERLGFFLELAGKAEQPEKPDAALDLARKREKELSFWPPFWFYYGKIAQARGDEALARRCFREFERRSRGCLKKNTYHAAMNLNRIAMLDMEEEAEARRVLEVMNRHLIPADWPKGLVAGLQYYTLGDRRRAEQQIQRNASELKVLVPVHGKLLGLLKQKSFAISALLPENATRAESGEEKGSKAGKPAVPEQNPVPEQKTVAGQPEKQQSMPITYQQPDTAKNGQPDKPAAAQPEKAELKPDGAKQAAKPAEQPEPAGSAMPAEKDMAESGGESRDPADLPVKNARENMQEGEAANTAGKGAGPADQDAGQGKPDSKLQEMPKADIKDHQADKEKDGQKADIPAPEKQHNALPASGTIGSRQEAGKDRDELSGRASEGNQTGTPGGVNTQADETASQENGPEPVRDAVQPDDPDSAAGQDKPKQQEQSEAENGQASDQDSVANAKDAKALYLLAMSHYRGENGKRDLVRAIMMLTQAAGQGNADAQTQLGFCHYTGNGVAKDKAKAVRYFSQAAEQGNTNAMFNLAVCYHNGDGVEKDIARAAELYTAAALKGETRSQYNLAMLYFRGEGVEKDVPRARKLLESLSAQGFVPARKAMEYLDKMHEKTEPAQK